MFSGILLILTLCWPLVAATETFEEELYIKPLRDGKVLSRFSFKTQLNGAVPRDPRTLDTDDAPQHYSLFPLALGQLLRQYAVTEMHLTLNAGRWKYDTWGYPVESGVGTGAEMWAWMGDSGSSSIDERWRDFRNGLAGIFCTSLGSMDEQRTTSPPYIAFAPEGHLPETSPHTIRHATLPSENVCTENLTPFLKLLPCKSLSGLAQLLNPHKLFDADWHGMGVHVLWDAERGVEVRLTFQIVSDPMRPVMHSPRAIALTTLFDRMITTSCPVAEKSQVVLQLPIGESYAVSSEPSYHANGTAVWDIATVRKPFDIRLSWQEDFAYPSSLTEPAQTDIVIHRVLSGSDQARGQLVLHIDNKTPEPVQLLYLETPPWIIQFYLHTAQIYLDGVRRNDLMANITYIPPIQHSRPATYHSVLTVPGYSAIQFSMDVTKAFLRYTEHPPDAQRGWDLPPAVFVPLNGTGRDAKRIYTPTLLVDLATPDFSMPYNVIMFTCTLIAFLFGSFFNLLTRKVVVVKVEEKNEDKDSTTDQPMVVTY